MNHTSRPGQVPKNQIITVIVGLLFLLAIGTSQPAAATTPQEMVQTTIEEVRGNIAKQKQAVEQNPNLAVEIVDKVLATKVDTARFGKLVLGKHWPNASTEQRAQFIEAYRRLLLRTYAVHASEYTDVTVDYLPVSAEETPGQSMVRTVVNRDGKPAMHVNYRLYQAEGQWKIYDVTADSISLVATFRASIDADIQQHGLDGVIASMQKRVNTPLAKR
jgi:phospholipid transport system substrate-binding protein